MLQKESKIRILENFHSLDYIFFGKPVKKMTSCCPSLIEDYTSVKGALMSLMVEMLKIIDHTPAVLDGKVSKESLHKAAKENAIIARENAESLVNSEKGRLDIKAALREAIKEDEDINIEEEVKDQIRQKAFSLAIDNLLVARALVESTGYEKLNDWEGKIIEDAYKVLRSNLVDSGRFILEANELLASE
jgi:hypothetical protein